MHSLALILAVLQQLVTQIQPAAASLAAPALAPHDISYLILSQPSSFHAERAQALRRSIVDQQSTLIRLGDQRANAQTDGGNVHLSHEIFADHEGSWAITPILKHIRASILKARHAGTRWLIICEENSHVNVSLLTHHLGKEDYRQELFFGYPLYDREATIIHHFAFFKNPSGFLYPYLRAGIALTVPLVDNLIQLLSSAGSTLTEFFIDAAHEFALLAWHSGKGNRLTPVSYLCARPGEGCAIHATPVTGLETCICHSPVDTTAPSTEQILFAVKTCEKFHSERVPVLQKTWAKYVRHLRLYSDTSDSRIPTIATTIPNTSIGHCAKTLEILHLINEEILENPLLADVRWIMLVDDDTILSPSALARYLSCFNPDQDVYMGERYGYHLLAWDGSEATDDGQGYNYVTGGGGIVISVKILAALLSSCECPSASSPDDMIIAACLYRLGVRPIHSPLFHQARPSDYPPETLDAGSISFHKHWQIDPYQVYNRWFRQHDEMWYRDRKSTPRSSQEPFVDDRPTPTEDTTLLQPKHISNDNDSTREEHGRLPRGITTKVAASQHSVHNKPDQKPKSAGVTTPMTNDYRRYQSEHISKHFCENNELQSNSNMLLLSKHRQSSASSSRFQEPNIIKHTEF
ncbi:beta-1,3-glucosyltransferase [Toxorhynchites rutilus septentrionalis]|uniref:beta-1,3-glucosyltransferase n=1 Tax=Toxorhynchites rutilus septentrionalis TaxID=329112 RepID=UPI002478D6C2|nr:beta-1,3-glucosyltransferase [Toxorhynchites rutilus septentrionalis]XP_055642144.1 beta-1,3-glucosyltransferase [Toxorhynchites rutilus septentrionalis]XP_055642145.1 beta-1,3-glucosyltransferase [Toxorhynchites rutilus septentrionalis]XP_055642146.1 beta-1,3-glucosyltransferase [Toxorhynchites rutilus septentrionalis]XP_055642147.1 beta-1,3-glucosyltransferase [Toxorhynchites rutilus septentrionalis]XP_055642148.1 beta-1,3-glucosyltransferase [Toxorhynchites rutilus septentrionalis]XP_05